MKHKALILLPLILATGAIFSVSGLLTPGLYPDTSTYPRIPGGSGTIASLIATLLGSSDIGSYLGDGTVTNSAKLAGVSGSGYLKSTLCTGTDIIVGVDANGGATCGARSTLLTYGTISDQSCPATVYKPDGTTSQTASGTVLTSGDTMQTPSGCTATITFEDSSVLRIDENTTIVMNRGTAPDGSPMANAIVENGQVWGRILSDTGSYSIGGDGIVAGVRGTSISYSSTGRAVTLSYNTASKKWTATKWSRINPILLSIIDSTQSRPATVACVTTILNTTSRTANQLVSTTSDTLVYALNSATQGTNIINTWSNIGSSYSIPASTKSCSTSLLSGSIIDPTTQYSSNTWIRSNTLKDLYYLKQLAQNPPIRPYIPGQVYISPSIKMAQVNSELLLTMPTTNEGIQLCPGGGTFWPGLVWVTPEACRPKLVRYSADFIFDGFLRQQHAPLRNIDGAITPVILNGPTYDGAITASGLTLTGSRYLEYATGSLGLNSSTITITYTGSIPINMVVADFWTIPRVWPTIITKTANWFMCNWTATDCVKQTVWWTLTTIIFNTPTATNIQIFVIGNNKTTNLTMNQVGMFPSGMKILRLDIQ